jgi:taurine dioxygenase
VQVAGTIGAEITLDLSCPLDSQHRVALNDALGEHLVLFFRDQQLDREALKRITKVFVPLIHVPYITPSPDDPDIIEVLKEAGEIDMVNFGGDWHSDSTFLDRPPAGSVLYALEISAFGGDTIWANQAMAYERLPDDLKAQIHGKQAIHTGAPYGAKASPDERLSQSIEMVRGDPKADKECLHPLVRSNRKALFVNPVYTVGIKGMTPRESGPLLTQLYQQATRPKFTSRFRWSKGAVAIWDNRMTMHYAINDYDGQRWLLWRTTFAGERPV